MKLSIDKLALIFITSFLFLIVVWLYRDNTHLKEMEFRYGNELESVKSKINSLLVDDYIRFQNCSLSINKRLSLSTEHDTIRFIDLVEQYNKVLIFRYSEVNCMACVEKEIINLINFVEQVNIELIILGSYSDNRDLYLFKRVNKIPDYVVYNIKEGGLDLPVENLNIPYYFVLDSNYITNNFFVPDKNFPDRSVKYLNSIVQRY